ncbi:MAG TPA: Nramp family divalent metal transporter [Chthoniobacteraceae bacterium]|nr:Nramp family divalent metal transporter [Chthoniobacteraceae bacterium]
MGEPSNPPSTTRRKHSLEGLHDTVEVPAPSAHPWRQYLAFAGPAMLVSVGYMDPGNWSTDLSAGAGFKYGLLWIVGLASLMAIFLQVISARLGVVTGKDLAQCCRDHLPRWTRWPNYISCEIAIAACDLAEVLGSAVAIHLLFPRISLLLAVCITACDVIILLSLQRAGMRFIEAVIVVLIGTIGVCYYIEIFVLPQITPNVLEVAKATVAPDLASFFHTKAMVVLAIGIIGATVMPHNLYLHSALVQSRKLQADEASVRRAIKFNTIDSVAALSVAFFVNSAILVIAAAVFYGKEHFTLAGGEVVDFGNDADWIQVAYVTLSPLLGTAMASVLFALALLASGQSSTITGTLAGQVVMEGFMDWKIRPWARRLITRLVAIIPAIALVGLRGEGSVNDLLNLSQVVLAIQLPLAMIPLLCFTGSKRIMGSHRNGRFLTIAGWSSCLLITALDFYGLPDAWRDAMAVFTK